MTLIKCAVCGHDVSSDANVCPNCGTPNFAPKAITAVDEGGGRSTNFLPMLLFLLIAGGIALGLYYASTSQSGKSIVAPMLGASTPPTPPPPPPPPPQQTVKNINIGDTFTVGSIQLSVISVSNMGSDLGANNPPPSKDSGDISQIMRPSTNVTYYPPSKTQGKYIQVKFSAKNVGQAESVLSSNFIIGLVDSQRRQFSLDLMDQPLLPGYDDYIGTYQTLKPGFSSKFVTIFEVAKDSNGIQLVFADQSGKVQEALSTGI